jgi:CHASE2 domain-containing sensor protein
VSAASATDPYRTNKLAATVVFGVLSVALTPGGALIAWVASRVLEASVYSPPDIPVPRRVVMTVMLFMVACTFGSFASAIVAWLRRERLRWLPIAGAISTSGLIGLFQYGALPD